MPDYQAFKHGAVQFPLPAIGSGIGGAGGSLLRDADPALFFLLEFYESIINTHVSSRLIEEATAVGASQFTTAVADVLPLNPEPYLVEEHFSFPLLAAYRKESSFQDVGQARHSVDKLEVAYVLPPLSPGQAERLLPSLKAVAAVIDNRTTQGMDPSYTPTGSTAGAHVWNLAGVAKAQVKGVSYGAYAATEDLYFPAVLLEVELTERSDVAVETFEDWAGSDVSIDIEDPADETVLSDVVEISIYEAPTLTLATPNSGTKAGGTTVTLTGTGFIVDTEPTVTFGGAKATNVVVLSATSLQCVTPAHSAYPTFLADVVVTNLDGQSGRLVAGYTFTSP